MEPIRDDVQQRLHVFRVRTVVLDERLQCTLVASFVLVPEPNGVTAADVGVVALDADLLLDRFQAAVQSEFLARVQQVDVRDRDLEVVTGFEKRDIEPLAVERDQQRRLLEFPREAVCREVTPLNERLGVTAPVEADRRHVVTGRVQPRRLDVQKAGLLSDVLVEPPSTRSRQPFGERGDIAVVEVGPAVVDEGVDPVGERVADNAPVELLPVGDPVLPQAAFGRLADAVDGDETVFDAHSSVGGRKRQKHLDRPRLQSEPVGLCLRSWRPVPEVPLLFVAPVAHSEHDDGIEQRFEKRKRIVAVLAGQVVVSHAACIVDPGRNCLQEAKHLLGVVHVEQSTQGVHTDAKLRGSKPPGDTLELVDCRDELERQWLQRRSISGPRREGKRHRSVFESPRDHTGSQVPFVVVGDEQLVPWLRSSKPTESVTDRVVTLFVAADEQNVAPVSLERLESACKCRSFDPPHPVFTLHSR